MIVVKGKMWSRRNGGKSTSVESIMDSGCTYPLTTTAVTKALNAEIEPLDEPLSIVEASGRLLKILGTVKLYLEADVLGGRKLVERAVIEGEGAKEVLISLGLMKKWDLIHQTFPHETITDYLNSLNNKSGIAYQSI